jgi:hypothetical protein
MPICNLAETRCNFALQESRRLGLVDRKAVTAGTQGKVNGASFLSNLGYALCLIYRPSLLGDALDGVRRQANKSLGVCRNSHDQLEIAIF